MEVAPLSGGENPGGVAHKHPPGDHHHGHDCDRGDHHGDCDDCDNFDNIPINSDEGGEEVGQNIAVTTAINIKGGGGRWERLVYYCGENNLCTPSPREHPSRGV